MAKRTTSTGLGVNLALDNTVTLTRKGKQSLALSTAELAEVNGLIAHMVKNPGVAPPPRPPGGTPVAVRIA